ncbi:O-methyltransferase [Jatrophihabitans sp.]|uniref:O-methyltransferase n=1 Tax=Jatrophihabitans sp. TaxID=1932789 RepID=UPI0030C6B156|nr:methyltransferase [Jatrophihabitans sp.]
MADAMLTESSLAYAESFAIESDLIADARERGHELGCVPIGPAGGATLRMLAVATGARSVVEVGTGAGVSGLYLLDGMAEDGQLVSIDIEAENQRAAREAFTEAGIAATRYRLINGAAADVLPRMRDAAYDLVFVDADKSAYAVYYEQAIRMLRPGGVVAFDNALWHDRVADPSQRDTETLTLRELSKTVRDDVRLASTLIAVSDGLLVAAKR